VTEAIHFRVPQDFILVSIGKKEVLEALYWLLLIILFGWGLGWYGGTILFALVQDMKTTQLLFYLSLITMGSYLFYLVASSVIKAALIQHPIRQIFGMLLNGSVFLRIRERPEYMLNIFNSAVPYEYSKVGYKAGTYPLISWLRTFETNLEQYKKLVFRIGLGRAFLFVVGVLSVGLFFTGVNTTLYLALLKSDTLKSLLVAALGNFLGFLLAAPYTFLILAVFGTLLYTIFLDMLEVSKYMDQSTHHVVKVVTREGNEYFGILNADIDMPEIKGFFAIDSLEYVKSGDRYYFASLTTRYIPIKEISQIQFYPITEFSDVAFQGLLVVSAGEDQNANRSEHGGKEDH